MGLGKSSLAIAQGELFLTLGRKRHGPTHSSWICYPLQLEGTFLSHLSAGHALVCLQLDLASLEHAQTESQGDSRQD